MPHGESLSLVCIVASVVSPSATVVVAARATAGAMRHPANSVFTASRLVEVMIG
jgi:hypothetical protein